MPGKGDSNRDQLREREREQQREIEREQVGGPADYDESGGTGLEPEPGDAVIGGGVSGSDEDPIGEPGIPDEVSRPRRSPETRASPEP